MIKNVGKLDEKQLSGLMKMLGGQDRKRELPEIDGDFWYIAVLKHSNNK